MISTRAHRKRASPGGYFMRALYRCGRNHVGPANVLSCASRPPASTRLAVTQGSFREAKDALNNLDKRRGNMRYGWLRKHGYCISSCHVEAAARVLVARRCKQTGMHWRHHNAACVCAIIARLRSAA